MHNYPALPAHQRGHQALRPHGNRALRGLAGLSPQDPTWLRAAVCLASSRREAFTRPAGPCASFLTTHREVRYQGGRRPASPRQARPLSSWQPKCYSADQGLQRGKMVWRVLSRQRRQTWILPCLPREQAPVVSNPTLSPKVTAQDHLVNFALGVSCRPPCSLPWRAHTSPFWFREASCLHFNS